LLPQGDYGKKQEKIVHSMLAEYARALAVHLCIFQSPQISALQNVQYFVNIYLCVTRAAKDKIISKMMKRTANVVVAISAE
jgi:hypothetical protein